MPGGTGGASVGSAILQCNFDSTNGGSWSQHVNYYMGCTVPSGSQTFSYTGSVQTFTVPTGITEVMIRVYGAQGGGSNGGKGGYSYGKLAVTAGSTLNIYIGGQGLVSSNGWNGGGLAYSGAYGGGGATDIRYGGSSVANRKIVAGGGGGSCTGESRTNGVGGGGSNAGTGGLYCEDAGGKTNAGGTNCSWTDGNAGENGSLGTGGNGGNGPKYFGGAGGGGYYGGAGGRGGNSYGATGSGGGSGYIGGVTSSGGSIGVNVGNGKAIICWGSTANNCPTL